MVHLVFQNLLLPARTQRWRDRGRERKGKAEITSSSAVAMLPRDASCLSVVSFNSTKRRVVFFIVSYVGYRFVTACS